MIGLIPEQMKLPVTRSDEEQFQRECEYAYNNALNVSKTMDANIETHALSVVCFVTDKRFIETVKSYISSVLVKKCIISVMAVENLPINAAVEFHFISHSAKGYNSILMSNSDSDTLNVTKSALKEYFKSSFSFEDIIGYTKCSISGLSKLCTINAGFDNSKTITISDLTTIFKLMIEQLINQLQYYSVVIIRCFYKAILPRKVVKGILKLYLDQYNIHSAMIIIPVIELEDNSILAFNIFETCMNEAKPINHC
jgi:hypothetical protein